MTKGQNAHLVADLYRHHKSWGNVAKAMCKRGSCHCRAYWYRIAQGAIGRPNQTARNAIVSETQLVTARNRLKFERSRKNVSFSTLLYQKMLRLKNLHSETWETFGRAALDARLKLEDV